jgi:hypothetical protein
MVAACRSLAARARLSNFFWRRKVASCSSSKPSRPATPVTEIGRRADPHAANFCVRPPPSAAVPTATLSPQEGRYLERVLQRAFAAASTVATEAPWPSSATLVDFPKADEASPGGPFARNICVAAAQALQDDAGVQCPAVTRKPARALCCGNRTPCSPFGLA